jgi:hypothetical protein
MKASSSRWPAFKDPNGLGRGADKHLIFDGQIREAKRLREAQCDFWEPYFFQVGVTGAVPAAVR